MAGGEECLGVLKAIHLLGLVDGMVLWVIHPPLSAVDSFNAVVVAAGAVVLAVVVEVAVSVGRLVALVVVPSFDLVDVAVIESIV